MSAGILTPIYQLAEMFAFPAFHWIAFAVMVAGVVSFGLQLTLGKLVVLASSGFSPAEILSDVLGLVVSWWAWSSPRKPPPKTPVSRGVLPQSSPLLPSAR